MHEESKAATQVVDCTIKNANYCFHLLGEGSKAIVSYLTTMNARLESLDKADQNEEIIPLSPEEVEAFNQYDLFVEKLSRGVSFDTYPIYDTQVYFAARDLANADIDFIMFPCQEQSDLVYVTVESRFAHMANRIFSHYDLPKVSGSVPAPTVEGRAHRVDKDAEKQLDREVERCCQELELSAEMLKTNQQKYLDIQETLEKKHNETFQR